MGVKKRCTAGHAKNIFLFIISFCFPGYRARARKIYFYHLSRNLTQLRMGCTGFQYKSL
ncbi:hypothetical protein HMPREF9554_02150 [Treponema phagedenis F0421]|nr:hypothetical protein HMPREF9554_02150 [Treponema phagedenis F0421]